MNIEEREKDFRDKVNRMISFPYELRKEFVEYWTEPNKSGTKMKFEMEPTWDLSRRLNRWAGNNFGKKPTQGTGQIKQAKMEEKSTIKEVQELDNLLEKYSQHPTSVPFREFGKYYDFLKTEKLLKPFSKLEILDIQEAYGNDKFMCRCACVQLTIQGYVDSGFTFSKVFEVRNRLNKV